MEPLLNYSLILVSESNNVNHPKMAGWVNGKRGQVCSELLLGIQNLQGTVEETVVGKANTEIQSTEKSGNAFSQVHVL